MHLAASRSLAGSELFFGVSSDVVPDILLFYFDFKLLRVLDMMSWRFDHFPVEQIVKLLLLRYLPSTLFKLPKLQTLFINGPWLENRKIPELPYGFWKCINMRHLQFHVATKFFTNKILTLTPNITKLGVCETYKDFAVVGLWDDFFQNLVLLEYIQTLKMSCFGQNRPLPLPSPNAFPHSLKNLTLRQSFLPWEAMKLIGDLPNVEVLKLRNYAFQGPEWETVEGGFQRKRYV
ncbi:hypothetical protein LIER_07654 [Lithospermum erythrorhizon]|uniref:Uncharacterized protein n=1 Tax=Lithospermum erythrorhizon TaxID=34254 RepID=A0AAV3PCV5_LITER